MDGHAMLPSMVSVVVPARPFLGLLLAALVAGACQPSPTSTPPPTATASPDPSAAAIAPATDAELQVMASRITWGLRSDLEHVRAVAADPRATEYLSILMLPDEIAEMQARAANADAVRGVIQAEANKAPDDFCGV